MVPACPAPCQEVKPWCLGRAAHSTEHVRPAGGPASPCNAWFHACCTSAPRRQPTRRSGPSHLRADRCKLPPSQPLHPPSLPLLPPPPCPPAATRPATRRTCNACKKSSGRHLQGGGRGRCCSFGDRSCPRRWFAGCGPGISPGFRASCTSKNASGAGLASIPHSWTNSPGASARSRTASSRSCVNAAPRWKNCCAAMPMQPAPRSGPRRWCWTSPSCAAAPVATSSSCSGSTAC